MSKIKLRIHTWPEKALQKKSKTVSKVNDEIRFFLDEMFLLMRVSRGAGLAANQVGLNLKLIVMQVQNRILKLVNPRIIKEEGYTHFLEGCLSFPGLELNVKRRNKIWIWALDEKGSALNLEAEGTLAIVLQHEIDHINGVTFIDRISFWQRLKIMPKLKKIAKGTQSASSRDG